MQKKSEENILSTIPLENKVGSKKNTKNVNVITTKKR